RGRARAWGPARARPGERAPQGARGARRARAGRRHRRRPRRRGAGQAARRGGRRHEVVGGIAIAEHGAITAHDVVVTAVDFRALDDATLDWYVATGEWQG